ncbi:MAG: glycosyltransferase family 4 protein [Candidatus Bathyarchaeia archaeon]
MKIAIVVERFPPDVGGSGTRYYKIAEHLSKRHVIDVFTLGKQYSADRKQRFNIYRLDPNLHGLPSSLNKLNRVIYLSCSTFLQFLSRSYDIIDVDIWPFLPFFTVKIAKPKTPVVVSWNVVWPFSYNKAVSKICEILAHPVSKVGDHHVTVSNFAKTILQKRFKIPTGKLSVIPNGIDKEFLKAKMEPQPGRIIFIGRLEPQKRIDLILKGFKIFKEKVSAAELHIIGSGSLQQSLLKASQKISGVYLHNPLPTTDNKEIIEQLRKSWVFISTSEFESYGLSIAEALSVGLPVLITKALNEAVKEFVKNGQNGLIVEHNKPTAIAKALEKLYRNQGLWTRLSQNARGMASFHSWDDVAKKVEEVYKKLTNHDLQDMDTI